MEAWIECGAQFIAADIVRWTEAVFENNARGRKPLFLGEREVTAEVLSGSDAKGFVKLLVRGCKIVSVSKNANAASPPLLDIAVEIRRLKKTLLKNGIQRLAWNDEAARSLVASSFLNDKPPAAIEPETTRRSGTRRKPVPGKRGRRSSAERRR